MIIKISKLISSLVFFLLTVEVINNSIVTILFPIPLLLLQLALYGSMFLVIFLFLKGFYIEWCLLLVVIIAILSLLLNDVEAKYNAPLRLGSWILLISTVGPLVYNPFLIQFREKLLEVTMIVFMWIGGLSFLYWLGGIPSIGRGHFSGLMNHSMVLAPVASLGGLYAFYRWMNEDRYKKKLLFLILFIFSSIDVILAASRTAFIAYVLGLSMFLFFNKFRFRKWILLGLMIGTVFLSIGMDDYGVDSTNTDSIATEMLSRGMKNTREALWNDRLLEFYSSPFFGVGFAAQKDDLMGKEGKEGGKFGGRVEPGSTYLMILSMTGILGAITLFIFFIRAILSKKFWRDILIYKSYKFSIFVFFFVHFIAEGYIYSSGALLAFVFWTLVGATYPYRGIRYKKKVLNR